MTTVTVIQYRSLAACSGVPLTLQCFQDEAVLIPADDAALFVPGTQDNTRRCGAVERESVDVGSVGVAV